MSAVLRARETEDMIRGFEGGAVRWRFATTATRRTSNVFLRMPLWRAFGALQVIDTDQRMFDDGPLTEVRPALRLPLVRRQRLEQRFLRVNRDGASAAGRGAA